MRRLFLFIFIPVLLIGCSSSSTIDEEKYMVETNWFNTGRAVNNSLVDVFYLVSTEVLEEKDEQGNDCYISKLTDDELVAINAEMGYARSMFGDSLNFFSPYYSQFTMSALDLPGEELAKVRKKASDDAANAFRYYIKNLNNGRPFILAGFSQGAMHLIDILRDMEPGVYKRMVAAYSLGYRISADDLKSPCVKAAKGADDLGVTVSFNSVSDTDAIWNIVSEDAATCINPINYRTDEEPAELVFEGDTLSVKVDTTHNVLIVSGDSVSNYKFPILERFCKPGNLHHWDLLFYKDNIRRNALNRAYLR